MLGLIGLLSLAHGLPLLAYLLLRGSVTNTVPEPFPDRMLWWQLYNFVTLLNEFTPWFFLPLPLWLLTLLIARRPPPSGHALPWALFMALYGAVRPPPGARGQRPAAPPAPETRLRVMTFNVLALRPLMDELVQIIEEADPDVLMVQELIPSIAQAIDEAHGDRLTSPACAPTPAGGAGDLEPLPHRGRGALGRLPAQRAVAARRAGRQRAPGAPGEPAPDHPYCALALSQALPVPVIVGQVSEARQLEVAWLAPA